MKVVKIVTVSEEVEVAHGVNLISLKFGPRSGLADLILPSLTSVLLHAFYIPHGFFPHIYHILTFVFVAAGTGAFAGPADDDAEGSLDREARSDRTRSAFALGWASSSVVAWLSPTTVTAAGRRSAAVSLSKRENKRGLTSLCSTHTHSQHARDGLPIQ